MAQRDVSSAVVSGGSELVEALIAIINQLATGLNTLTAKLDAEDVTNLDTDYAAQVGTVDTINLKGVNTPT